MFDLPELEWQFAVSALSAKFGWKKVNHILECMSQLQCGYQVKVSTSNIIIFYFRYESYIIVLIQVCIFKKISVIINVHVVGSAVAS